MDSYIREVVERGGGAIYESKIVEYYNKKQEPFFKTFGKRMNVIQERNRQFAEFNQLGAEEFKRRFLKRH